MIAETSTAETKRCEDCCEVKPLGEFRRCRQGAEERRKECRTFRNEKDKQRRLRKKFKRDGNAIAETNRELNGAANFGQVQFAIGRAMSFFGGLEDYVDAWEQQTKAELARNRGGRRSSDFFAAVANGYALCRQVDSVDLAGLNDEGRAEKLARMLLALQKSHPSATAAGMRKAGWPQAGDDMEGQANGHAKQ